MKRNKQRQTLDEFLAAYDADKFTKPAVTADCVVFARHAGRLSLLTVTRGNHPCIGEIALPGGFCEKGESCYETAVRELSEETGQTLADLRELCFVSTPNRDPRDWIMSAVYGGLVDTELFVVGGDDAAKAEWLEVKVDRTAAGARLTLGAATAELAIARTPRGKLDFDRTTVTGCGIAFDHAKIIVYAYEELIDNQK